MSIGGSASKNEQYQRSFSEYGNQAESSGGSFVDPNQVPFLDMLREMAMGNYSATQPQMDAIKTSVNTTGNDALAGLIGLGNTDQVVDAQLAGLRSGLSDIHQQGLNTIGDNAINAGAFGGSRHGIAEAALAGEIGDAFTRGYGDIIANASNQAIVANNSVLSGGGQLVANNLTADWAPLQALAGIIGNPTVLSEQESTSTGYGHSFSEGQGEGQSGRFGFGFK